MKKNSFLLILLVLSLSGCKFIDSIRPKSSKTALITGTMWKIETLRDAADKNLKNENLDPRAQGLYAIIFDFKANKIVRASDKISKQIVNQGTWAINTDETIMTFDLPEFSGDFKVVQVSYKSLLLQYQSEKNFAGLGKGVQLLLTPDGN